MNAKKCDRCGSYYENYDGVAEGAQIIQFKRRNNFIVYSADLCPECMAKLWTWMGGEELDE